MIQNFTYQPPKIDPVILYEDDDFIAVNKPAGLLSVPGRLPEHQDSAYLRILEQYPFAKVTHRLDMATSGILLFAKHRHAEVAMSKIFQARMVKKHYIALVDGCAPEEGEINVPLQTDWENRPRQKIDFEKGKAAQTFFERLEYNEKLHFSRVKLIPITGRSHQLRVHLMSIGHAILGDNFYHSYPENNHLDRMALHATQLSFIQPFLNGDVNILSQPEF